VKRAIIQLAACWVILSFFAVITADYWRNCNVANIVIVEIEPKKSAEKSSDSKNDLKEDLKGKFHNHVAAFSSATTIALNRIDQQTEHLPSPYLSLPDLPPEIV
jgi:hypothetical protein